MRSCWWQSTLDLIYLLTLITLNTTFVYIHRLSLTYVKTTQNSTGGTGAHSAGKLTKTEVSGEEDSWLWEKKEDKPLLFSFSQISVLLLVVTLFYLFTSNWNKRFWLGIAHDLRSLVRSRPVRFWSVRFWPRFGSRSGPRFGPVLRYMRYYRYFSLSRKYT